jgi:putative salt-induced outer membrane protein
MNIRAAAARIGVLVPFALAAVATHATPVPPSVAAMIDAAAGDPAALKTVSDLAKKTNPDSTAEIDAQVAKITAANDAARTEKLEHQSFTEGWSGEGSLGAFASSGNTSSSGVALALKLAKESLKWKNTFGAGINYQKDDGVKTQERYFVGDKLDYKFSDRLYAYGLLGWEHDKFAGYDSRFSESLGLGYKLIATPKITLGLEGGPALRQTSYVSGIDDSVFNGRVAGNFVWNIGPTTAFSEVASYYFGSGGNTLTSDTALTSKLYNKLSARLSFYVQNESDPQPGHEATDTTTRLMLVYGF